MAITKFKLNYEGVGELLRSKEVQDVCAEMAQEVADRAGDGYEVVKKGTGKKRVYVDVAAVTKEAKQDNYDNNTLLKALNK